MKTQGFTLLEMLIALAVSSLLMLGAARMLPQLQTQSLRLMLHARLHEELQQIMHTLEKAVRRAGYCHGHCQGAGLQDTRGADGCLRVRWDENSNGQWEVAGHHNSEVWGYRLRASSLEMQRGIANCHGGGWERLNDPRTTGIDAFQVIRTGRQVKIMLSGYVRRFPDIRLDLEHWLTAENL